MMSRGVQEKNLLRIKANDRAAGAARHLASAELLITLQILRTIKEQAYSELRRTPMLRNSVHPFSTGELDECHIVLGCRSVPENEI